MWVLLALGASLFWGMTYVLNEHVYRHISVLSSIAITLVASGVAVGTVALLSGVLGKDITTITSSPKVAWLVLGGILTLTIAELLIGFSIVGKNATIAGLIEISYPLFIVLFSFLVFKEFNFNLGTGAAAILIFLGVGMIYLFNK